MTITLSGKGGIGKTSIVAILIDVLRHQFEGRILAIDADPAMTLSMALDVLPPAWTLADVRDNTPLNALPLKELPSGIAPSEYILDSLISGGVIAQRQLRGQAFDFLVMGHSEGTGCFCRVNQALTQALTSIRAMYDVILIDNEAGIEWLSRYRITEIDLFLLVLTTARSSWMVADRIRDTINMLELDIGQIWQIYKRTDHPNGSWSDQQTIILPECETIAALDRQNGPLLAIEADHPVRRALAPIVKRITSCVPATAI